MSPEAAEIAARRTALAAVAAVQDHAPEAAALLKALANEQRLLVMCALLGGPLSVGEINDRVTLSQSALSQHLAVLREAGLVTTRRQSQTIYYALAHGPAVEIMEALYAAFCAPATPRARRNRSRAPARASRMR